jgi:large subunit ribosomal protein L35
LAKGPKIKGSRSAAKRFSKTGTGKIKYQKAFKRHLLAKKSKKRKRALSQAGFVSGPDRKRISRLLPNK